RISTRPGSSGSPSPPGCSSTWRSCGRLWSRRSPGGAARIRGLIQARDEIAIEPAYGAHVTFVPSTTLGRMEEPAADAIGRDELGELIGLEYLETSHDEVRARIAVTDRVRQPVGLVHGGVYAA